MAGSIWSTLRRVVSRARVIVPLVTLVASSSVCAQTLSLNDLGARLALDPDRLSLSGISSGAFMAQQFHVAHSAHIVGVGLFAGGPYRCAAGVYSPFSWLDLTGLYAATSKCSNTNPFWIYQGPPDVAFSVRETRTAFAASAVDDPRSMHGDRVWLFSGGQDNTVPPSVVDALSRYYEVFVGAADIRHKRIAGAGHAMITEEFGNACGVSESPFISDCDFDAAGQLLTHIHGALNPPAAGDVHAPLAFDQSVFFERNDASVSLHSIGHVYVPNQCRQGASCRLHVAFHGCQQTQDQIGDAFYTNAGYNEWAESNGIVVLYPQTIAWAGSWFSSRSNPLACWDWWGYSGDDYHRKDGKQMRAVAAMVNALMGADVLATRVPGR